MFLDIQLVIKEGLEGDERGLGYVDTPQADCTYDISFFQDILHLSLTQISPGANILSQSGKLYQLFLLYVY